MRAVQVWLAVVLTTALAYSGGVIAPSPSLSATEQAADRSLSPTVVGGAASTNPGYVVALFDSGESDAGFAQFCGGSLISPTVVLTAAHCVEALAAADVDVAVGATYLSMVAPGDRLAVAEIAIHPRWVNGGMTETDLALLRLSRSAVGAPTVVVENTRLEPTLDRPLTAFGWGFADPSRTVLLDALQAADVVALSGPSTNAADATSLCLVVDPADDFCVGGVTTGTCQGDSGGPILGETSVGSGRFEVVGVISFGPAPQCLHPTVDDAAQRVAPHKPWIDETMAAWDPAATAVLGAAQVNCSSSAVHNFTDVDDSYASADVGCIYALGVTTGTSPTTYGPHNPVTREQMAAFMARLYRRITGENCGAASTPFTDTAGSFAAGDIGCIYTLGVTTGTSATTYSPKDAVTRQQMATFIAGLYRTITGENCGAASTPFTDTAGSFAAGDIGCIYTLGVTTGTSATTYAPANLVTREQMAAFIARLYRTITG